MEPISLSKAHIICPAERAPGEMVRSGLERCMGNLRDFGFGKWRLHRLSSIGSNRVHGIGLR
jgi:hypothetical protein